MPTYRNRAQAAATTAVPSFRHSVVGVLEGQAGARNRCSVCKIIRYFGSVYERDADVRRSLNDSPPTKSAEMAKVRVRMNVPTMTSTFWAMYRECRGLDATGIGGG